MFKRIVFISIFVSFLTAANLSAGIAWVPTLALTAASLSTSSSVLTPGGIVKKEDSERLKRFIADNSVIISGDIARGSGESLEVISELLHIPVENRSSFHQALQSDFDSIYPKSDVSAESVSDSIIGIAVRYV